MTPLERAAFTAAAALTAGVTAATARSWWPRLVDAAERRHAARVRRRPLTRRRHHRQEGVMGAPNCPTPAKRGHSTRAAAKRQLWTLLYRSRQPDRGLLHAYLCTCGMWHVGHIRTAKRRRS